MIQTRFGHIVFHIYPQNISFYKDLFAFLGWSAWVDGPTMLGFGHEEQNSLWFSANAKETINDYDGPGMNHIGLNTKTLDEVDQMAAYLRKKGIPLLFETPRHRPEFTGSPDQTYYQVMFESPDRILFEVLYTGPHKL